MKLKIKNNKTAIYLILYFLFTIACGCFGWLFGERRILLFQIWYQVTAVIGLALAVTVVVLLARLLKLNKLKNEIKHWKE